MSIFRSTTINRLTELEEALNNKKSVAYSEKSGFYIHGRFVSVVLRLLRRIGIFHFDRCRLNKVADAYTRFLELRERQSFNVEEQKQLNERRDRIAEKILEQCAATSCKTGSLNLLRLRRASLRYRTGLLQPTDIDVARREKIVEIAEKWKKGLEECPDHQKMISKKESKKLEAICQYPEFFDALVEDQKTLENFLKWTVIGKKPNLQAFVEYASIIPRLDQTYLSKRIGFYGGNHIEIFSNVQGKKDLGIPFEESGSVEPKIVSILTEQETVTLRNNWKLTVKEIFDQLAQAKYVTPPFEMAIPPEDTEARPRIMNYHVEKIGYRKENGEYELIPLEGNFWERLPYPKKQTKEKIESRYNVKLNDDQSLIMPSATCGSKKVHVVNSHGFVQAYIKIENKNNEYRLFPNGLFTKNLPQNALETVSVIVGTDQGTIYTIDPNIFYTHRMKIVVTYPADPKHLDSYTTLMRDNFEKSRSGDLCFQLPNSNCAHFAENVTTSTLDLSTPLYQAHVLETNPPFPVGNLFRLIRLLPSEKLQWTALNLIEEVLLPRRGLVIEGKFVCVANSNFHNKQTSHFPHILNKKVEDGELSGVTYLGYTPPKLSEIAAH